MDDEAPKDPIRNVPSFKPWMAATSFSNVSEILNNSFT